MRYYIRLIVLIVALLLCSQGMAQPSVVAAEGDSVLSELRVSLVTCSPGAEVYQLFGHSALRVQRSGAEPFDMVFNYGMFSFNSGNFVYRFVKGETDYMLGVYDFAYFMTDYVMRGSKVMEQELNLTGEEKERLLALLIENASPEHRVYRYNFLFDNCATRPRDRVEQAVAGSVRYNDEGAAQTFREEMHHYGDNYSWLMLGIDLALGHDLDRNATWREQMFVPMILQEAVARAEVISGDSVRPLVSRTVVLFDPESSPVLPATPWYLSPWFVALLFFIIGCEVTVVGGIRRRDSRWFDTLFYGLCFVGGCIIYFLIFFSEHPATAINFNALWLTPFALIPAVLPYVRRCRRVVWGYHIINLVALALFLIVAVVGLQSINVAVYPLVALSALRSCNYLVICKK